MWMGGSKHKTKGVLMRKAVVFLIALSLMISAGGSISYAKTKKAVPEEVVIGPKKAIAVMDFENKAGIPSAIVLGSGMAEMLTTSLVNTGKFCVVERKAVSDILQEQNLAASGRTKETGAAKIGKMLNAQILVHGAITEFEAQNSGGGQGFSYAGLSLGMSQRKAHVAVNIRLYDATTGEIIDSLRCEGKASASGIDVGANVLGAGFNTGSFTKTPLGKATQQVIDQAVAFIIERMSKIPWQGSVVTVKEGLIYMNAGKNLGIQVGDEFNVYKKTEELVDPESGTVLGNEVKKIGRIKIAFVDEKFSKANIVSGEMSDFAKGDIIKME